MDNEEVMEKYGITKKLGIGIMLQTLLIIAALVVTIVGLVRNIDIHRTIIYAGQCIACVLIIIFGIFRFKDRDRKFFKIVLMSYALLEALRAALLNTTGVNSTIGAIARFILAVLACNCVLVVERMDQKSSEKVALGMVVLEIVLYLVFLLGFPGVMLGHLNRFMPLVGVLIAGSITLLLKGKNMQLGTADELDDK